MLVDPLDLGGVSKAVLLGISMKDVYGHGGVYSCGVRLTLPFSCDTRATRNPRMALLNKIELLGLS